MKKILKKFSLYEPVEGRVKIHTIKRYNKNIFTMRI